MRKRVNGLAAAFLAAALCQLCWGQKLPGRPTSWVSDFAGVVDDRSRSAMETLIAELEQKTGAEIAVVTVRSLDGFSVEEYAVKLFASWGIGKRKKDTGVLLIAAVQERRVRIEVGYGLEGILPDGVTGEILDTYVLPSFREGKYGAGLYRGVAALAVRIAQDAGVELTGAGRDALPQPRTPSLLEMILGAFVFLILMSVFIRNPFLFLLLISGGRGGFGGGGGFGSGGGFGGFGGGMSGGGGASRSW